MLKDNTRQEDILCRYGGDEFIVVLKHMGDSDIVTSKGNKICSDFSRECSGGCVIADSPENTLEALITSADRALYVVKAEHKGRCGFRKEEEK